MSCSRLMTKARLLMFGDQIRGPWTGTDGLALSRARLKTRLSRTTN